MDSGHEPQGRPKPKKAKAVSANPPATDATGSSLWDEPEPEYGEADQNAADLAKIREEKLCKRRHRMQRIAEQLIQSLTRSMSTILLNIKEQNHSHRVANQLDIGALRRFEGIVQASYVLNRGEKSGILYFVMHDKMLYEETQSLLIKDSCLREQLTKLTTKIQFGCPSLGKGIRFKSISKGMFGGKKIAMYSFDLEHAK